jgi:ABC-type transport system involved in multi-copper enzyme maturation permease subunit
MLINILIREIQNHLYSVRFQIAMVISLLTFMIGSAAFLKEFKENKKIYDEYATNRIEQTRKMAERNASELAINRQRYRHFPRTNNFLSDCKENFFPDEFVFSAFNVFSFNVSSKNINPYLVIYQQINWSFIVTIILSFLALLLSFDAISGEKETHTLALCMSNSVSRPLLLLGKYLGVIITVLIALLLGVIISVIILLIGGIQFTQTTFAEIFLFLFASIVFISCITAFGLLSSVITRNSNISLLASLVAWIFFLVVIPNTSLFWAGKFFPIAHIESVQERIHAERKIIEDSYPTGKWSSSSNKFMPEHQIRAGMQMDFMKNEKMQKDAYYQEMFGQFEKTRNIVMLSPIELLNCIDEGIVNGGYIRFKNTWEELHAFQPQFLEVFKKFDADDDESPHWYNPYEGYSTTSKPIPFERVPVFEEQTTSIAKRIKTIRNSLVVMISYIFFACVLTFILFRRYDVR